MKAAIKHGESKSSSRCLRHIHLFVKPPHRDLSIGILDPSMSTVNRNEKKAAMQKTNRRECTIKDALSTPNAKIK